MKILFTMLKEENIDPLNIELRRKRQQFSLPQRMNEFFFCRPDLIHVQCGEILMAIPGTVKTILKKSAPWSGMCYTDIRREKEMLLLKGIDL